MVATSVSRMNAWWERLRWRIALVAGVLLVLLVLVTHETAWGALGILHFPFYFADTMAVLSAGQNWHAGGDIYQPNPFDPFGRPHVYGPWWLVTGPMGLTINDAVWIGPLLGLGFVLVATAVLAPRRPVVTGVAFLLLVSPPVLMAIERGNNDLVVFVLLAAAGALLARTRRPAALGAALITLAAALKVYPVAALAALAARPARRRAVLGLISITAGFCLLIFLLWRTDYTRAMGIAPVPWSLHTYGLRVLAWMWDWPQRPVTFVWQWAVSSTVAAGAAIWLLRRARLLWGAIPPTGAVAGWFVAGASSWCFCYLANSNYPYRAVLLLLPARLWFDQAAGPDPQPAGAARVQLAALVALGWSYPFKSWSASRIDRPSADLGLATVVGLEQMLVAAVTVALLISLTGWAWRHWRED